MRRLETKEIEKGKILDNAYRWAHDNFRPDVIREKWRATIERSLAVKKYGKTQLKMAPTLSYALAIGGLTITATAIGWAVGPVAGSAVAGLFLLGLLAIAAPDLAFAAFAAIIISNAAEVATVFHGAPSVSGLMVPILGLLLIARRIAGLEDLTTTLRVAVPAALYLAIHGITVLWTADPGPTIDKTIELAKNALIVLVFCGFATTLNRFQLLVTTIGITAVILSSVSLFQLGFGAFESNFLGFSTASMKGIAGEEFSWRLQGPLPDPNYYGQLLVMMLPIVASLALASTSRVIRLVGLFGTPAIAVAMLFTYSRGAVVGAAAMLFCSVLFLKQRAAVMGGASVLALMLAAALPHNVMDRIGLLTQAASVVLDEGAAVSDPALANRFAVVKAAVAMFASAPLTGVGFGQFTTRYPEFANKSGLDLGAPSKAHSLYLEISAEGGLIGLVAFLALLSCIVFLGLYAARHFDTAGQRAPAAMSRGLVLGYVGYLATAAFLHGDYTRYSWLVAALIIASAAIASRISRESSPTIACNKKDRDNAG